MPTSILFLLAGLLVATLLSLAAWIRHRGPRSPVKSSDEFRRAMRAIAPPGSRRRGA